MSSESNHTDRGTVDAKRPSDATGAATSHEATQGVPLAGRVVNVVKRGIWWTARFYAAIFAFGIAVYLLKLLQTAVPPLSGAIYAVRVLIAIAGMLYLATMLPTWFTDRLERTQFNTGSRTNWGRLYVLYRIFR